MAQVDVGKKWREAGEGPKQQAKRLRAFAEWQNQSCTCRRKRECNGLDLKR